MHEGLKELKQIELKWQYGVFTFIPNFEIIEKELKKLYELEKTTVTFSNVQQIMLELDKSKKALEFIKKCPFDLLEWAKNYDDVNDTNFYDLLKEVLN